MENTVLCGANSYKQKYYLNPKFDMLPQSIKDELKVYALCIQKIVGELLP